MYKITREELLTIPNMLTFYRILCIPVFAVLYLKGHLAVSLIVLGSGMFTDLIDGKLARKLNQVTQLGIVLDPFADKLTQGVIVICLLITYPELWIMLGLMIVKEGFMLFAGTHNALKYESYPKRSEWYGKVCCVITDAALIAILVHPSLPEGYRDLIVGVCCGVMLLTLLLYIRFYAALWISLKNSLNGEEAAACPSSLKPETRAVAGVCSAAENKLP